MNEELPPLGIGFPGGLVQLIESEQEGVTVEPASIEIVDDRATVRLRVTKLTTEWEVKRQAGGAYTSDATRGFIEYAPVNLEISVSVDHARALQKEGGDAAILGEVFHQLSWGLQTQINGLVVDHFKAVEAVKATELKITPRPTVELREVKAETVHTEQI